jgi:hypothetical protein
MGLLDAGPKEESAFRTAEQIAELVNDKNLLMEVVWGTNSSPRLDEHVAATVVEVNLGDGFVKAVQVEHKPAIQEQGHTITGYIYLVGPFELRRSTPDGGGPTTQTCMCSLAFAIKHRKRRVTRKRAST